MRPRTQLLKRDRKKIISEICAIAPIFHGSSHSVWSGDRS